MPTLSIVTTMYRSSPYLREFHERASAAAGRLGLDCEFVFVDDGSPDNSLAVALALRSDDPRVHVVQLSRNFGHHKAVMAGLMECAGDYVFLLDCDLEEPPEALLEFWDIREREGCDVVFGVQSRRNRGIADRLVGGLFYRVFNHFSDHPIPANIAMCRLMTRAYVDSLRLFEEKNFFLGATFQEAGFHQVAVTIDKRDKGATTYHLRRKISLMVNAVTSTSSRPLVYVFFIGMAVSGIAFTAGLVVLYTHLFIMPLQVGWPSLILSIWFLCGLILLSIGVVGVYVSKIFQESKRKPAYIIRQIDGTNPPSPRPR